MDEADCSPSGSDDEEEDNDDKLENYDNEDDNDDELRCHQAEAEAAAEDFADPSPSTGHYTDNYGHSQQYYLHQKNMLLLYRHC